MSHYRYTPAPRKCKNDEETRMLVHLSRVCRQIYHETVLRPFTHATWDFDRWNFHGRPGSLFFIPGQVKAITRMQLSNVEGFRASKVRASFLKELEHVEIHFLVTIRYATTKNDPELQMKTFKKRGGVEWLKGMGLKSIHFTALAEGDPPTAEIQDKIVKWMEREEAEILGN